MNRYVLRMRRKSLQNSEQWTAICVAHWRTSDNKNALVIRKEKFLTLSLS